MILTSESVDEILWCNHSNETSSAVLSHVTVHALALALALAHSHFFADFRHENYNRNTTKRKTITFVKRKSYLFNANREKKYNFTPKLDAATLAGARVYDKMTPGFRTNLGPLNT